MSDYLSDEDAERMLAAFDAVYNARLWDKDTVPKDDDLAAIRAVWSARPESARRLDEVALKWTQRHTAVSLDTAMVGVESRGRELLKGEGE